MPVDFHYCTCNLDLLVCFPPSQEHQSQSLPRFSEPQQKEADARGCRSFPPASRRRTHTKPHVLQWKTSLSLDKASQNQHVVYLSQAILDPFHLSGAQRDLLKRGKERMAKKGGDDELRKSCRSSDQRN